MKGPAGQERFERVRWRAKQARAARHARVLSRFWHTSQGLIWQVMSARPGPACQSAHPIWVQMQRK